MKLHEYKKKYRNKKQFLKEYKRIEEGKNLEYNISHLVTEARRYAGITQKQLAKIIKTKQPAIARIESGNLLPNVAFLQKIADAIGTTLIIKWGFMIEAEMRNETKSDDYDVPILMNSPCTSLTFDKNSRTRNTFVNA